MSQFTTELRYLIDQGYDFGLTEYEIFDETYREVLNKKILDHYRFDEIGFETPARFKHYLNTTMNEIMPYYNMLYRTELDKINPFHLTDYTESSNRKIDGLTEAEGKGTTSSNDVFENEHDSLSVHSTSPGGMIEVGDLKSHTWADDGTLSEGKNKQTSTSSDSTSSDSKVKVGNLEDYVKTVKGNMGGRTHGEILKTFTSSMINIDLMVIKELSNLFMGIY